MISTAMTLSEALRAVAGARPGQEVLVCGEERLTNRELLRRVGQVAERLRGRGIGNGDRVGLLLPPGPDFVFHFFAAASLGAVVVPLGPELRGSALAEILRDAQPSLLATARPVDDELLRRSPSLRSVIRVGPEEEVREQTALRDPASSPAGTAAAKATDVAALLYTSGTTETPKATVHTHRSLLAPVVATLKVRELWMRPSSLRTVVDMARALTRYRSRLLRSVGRPQTIMSTTGWQTITGLHVMFQGLLMGDRLAILPKFHPRGALELVAREHVTVLVAVPTAYEAILALPDIARYDTSSLLVCASGGAACPPSLAREIQRQFKCALYNGFGMTEAAGGISVSTLADSAEQQAESVGRPMPGIEVRIVDKDRNDLPSGEVGELAVRGEGVMMGYYRSPELTAAVLDEDGWLFTGDLARADERGYLHIVGRKKDLIIRGGRNIYPAEIERHLDSHPKIAESAVVGVPSPVGGESAWAFVRLKEGASMSAVELLDYCRGVLESYKIPSQVRFLTELPGSETGKSQKFKLREAAVRELQGGES